MAYHYMSMDHYGQSRKVHLVTTFYDENNMASSNPVEGAVPIISSTYYMGLIVMNLNI